MAKNHMHAKATGAISAQPAFISVRVKFRPTEP